MVRLPIEVLTSSASTLSTLIQTKQISPVELVSSYIERIEQLNPTLNAFITTIPDSALKTARNLEQSLLQGNSYPPLFGLPYAIKDAFFTSDASTTAGSRILSSYTPNTNATVIERLNSAGAILIGKLNMTEFGMGTGDYFPYGTPRNPWDTSRSPGFSSSGSGIATAASLCAFSIAEDTGGSVRIPASHCGATGLRPSQGLVSRHGSIPISSSFDIAGPITKTAKDVALVMDSITGYDPLDPSTVSTKLPSFFSAVDDKPTIKRIGLITEMMEEPYIDQEIGTAIYSSLDIFRQEGFTVEPCSLPASTDAMAVVAAISESEALTVHSDTLKQTPESYGKLMRRRVMAAHLIPSRVYQHLLQIKQEMLDQIKECFTTYQLLVCPTQLQPAPAIVPLEDLTTEKQALGSYTLTRGPTGLAALGGCPAISIPCGTTSSNLPIGLQIIGAPFQDLAVMQLANLFQQHSSWHTLLPDI